MISRKLFKHVRNEYKEYKIKSTKVQKVKSTAIYDYK